ncbi:hypothetical protein ACFYM5_23575 [Streptomyces sp. NPDC006706]|uniref:hypothetical protein n=1 Tax=Streptomyces sp. NPDC006706 TaxID=3364761 RepID=UPI00368CCE1A
MARAVADLDASRRNEHVTALRAQLDTPTSAARKPATSSAPRPATPWRRSTRPPSRPPQH